MTVIDDRPTRSEDARYCPECGHLASGARYCPGCGYPINVSATTEATAEHAPLSSSRVAGSALPGDGRRASRLVPIAAVSVLVLAAICVAAIIVLTGSNRDHGQTYSQKLSSALAPLVTANTALSSSLQALHGSDTRGATNATRQAQQALFTARGAVAALGVPRSSTQVSQQTQEALAQENGYLQSVADSLSNPTGNAVSGLQGLASNTSSAFVPLASVAAGAQASLSGTDALVSWAQGQASTQKHRDLATQRKTLQQAAAVRPRAATAQQAPAAPQAPSAVVPTAYVTPSGNPVPGSWNPTAAPYASGLGAPYAWNGGQSCDQNIFAGGSTSCSFANNVFQVVAAASHYQNLIPGSITAYAPASNTSFALTCTEYFGTDNQNDLQCITGDGTGAAFPVWAATVYYG